MPAWLPFVFMWGGLLALMVVSSVMAAPPRTRATIL